MGSSKPSNIMRAKAIGESSVNKRSNDALAKVIGKASIKRGSMAMVARATEKTSNMKRTKAALTKVVKPTKIEIIPIRQSRPKSATQRPQSSQQPRPQLVGRTGTGFSEFNSRIRLQGVGKPIPTRTPLDSESSEAVEQLQDYFDNTPRDDKRQKRLPITLLDQSQLQRVVGEAETITLLDRSTRKPFGAVIRSFMGNEDVLPARTYFLQRRCRLDEIFGDDRGKTAQYGYTCGERKSPSFMWARNLTRVTYSERFLGEQRHGITSYNSLLWATCKKKLNSTITAEAEACWKDLPPLGWNSLNSSIEPVISIKVREQNHELTGLPLGPPSGVYADKYEKLKWAMQSAEAVAYIHTKGVLHCDVGVGNLLLDKDLDIKLCDFQGKLLHPDGTVYLDGGSGENIKSSMPRSDPNDANQKTDIFALGSAIYFMMKDHPPFPELDPWKDTLEIVSRFKAGRFPALDEELCGEVVQKCWAGRYESADEVVHGLKNMNMA